MSLLTLLRWPALVCGRTGTLKLLQLIPKNSWELLFGLINNIRWECPLAIVFSYQLSKFLPFNWATRVLVGFKKNISDYFSNKLIFLLMQEKYHISIHRTVIKICSINQAMDMSCNRPLQIHQSATSPLRNLPSCSSKHILAPIPNK